MADDELVVRPRAGRTFASSRRVRLSDADARGVLRADGLARFLQDVATDDWDDAAVPGDEVWVVRRSVVQAVGEWPRLGESVELVTWCAGTGAAWAERRTDAAVAGVTRVRASSLWVPIGADGRPRRMPAGFTAVYGEATGGRRVPGRVTASAPGTNARRRPFALRASDVDVVGHVNNALAWHAVAEVAPARVARAEVTYHAPIEAGDDVTLAVESERLWLCVGDEVRVSGRVEGE